MKKKQDSNISIEKIKERTSRTSLVLVLSIFIFLILLAAIALSYLFLIIFTNLGLLEEQDGTLKTSTVAIFMSISSLIIGGTISYFSSRLPLKPINEIINKMNRLAAGDFKARLKFGNIISSHPAARELTESFNTMASELENTELLRNDFINNFSHEFKTPIVSISGFANLLSKGNLSDEQKQLYLASIREESMRLATMASNVLNLSKVENQTILTDVTTFNLSEQIRSAVLLLESKWSSKNIDLQIDFDEYEIDANEELLKQIWINLMDNAVKFVPRCGTVELNIKDIGYGFSVTVSNTGIEIPKEKQEKIFNKFYQADESHSTQGNGIGLAIVKKIVDLHSGSISVKSGGGITSFTVTLPKHQAK